MRAAAVILMGGMVALLWVGCDRGATGVEACRRIEARRCELIIGCPGVNVVEENDVVRCRLFYRDQCLFGMADGANPDDAATEACLAALEQAAGCRGQGDNITQCSTPPELIPEAVADRHTACLLLQLPERLGGCSFLFPPPPPPAAGGMGGEGGVGGTGGAGGAGGAGGGA